jgi:hypothetical protein
MERSSQLLNQNITLLILLVTLFSSCVTTYETGFNHYRKEMNIDISKHNLAYQYSHDSLFELPIKNQIDVFDQNFLDHFESNIKNNGFQINQYSTFQNTTLSNCLIDFSLAEPKYVKLTNDSFPINKFASTLVCQSRLDTNPNKLFVATYDTYQEFELISKKDIKSKSIDHKQWGETPNYYYQQKPISQNQAYLISIHLSQNATQKLDSINNSVFSKNHPELAQKTFKKRDPSNSGDGFVKVLGIIVIVFFSILISPPN